MPQTLSIAEAKARFPELVADVEERDEEIIVMKKGKPAAVLVNYSEYERLKETLEVLSDPQLMQQIRSSLHFYAEGKKGFSFEEVFDEPLAAQKKRKRR
jgi:antitoxin YefM